MPVLSVVTFRHPLTAHGFLCTLQSYIGFALAVFLQVAQSETTILLVVRMDEALPISACSKSHIPAAHSTMIITSPRLHTSPCLQAGNAICRHPVLGFAVQETVSIRVAPGEVQEVHPSKDDEESTEK